MAFWPNFASYISGTKLPRAIWFATVMDHEDAFMIFGGLGNNIVDEWSDPKTLQYNKDGGQWVETPSMIFKSPMAAAIKVKSSLFNDICSPNLEVETSTATGTESTGCTYDQDTGPGEFCTDQDPNFCRDSFTDTEGVSFLLAKEKCNEGGLGECKCRKSCNDILNSGFTGDKVGEGFCWLLGQ